MKSQFLYLLAGLFLPLFPFSMVFNALYGTTRSLALRVVLVLVWPQIGLALVSAAAAPVPDWAVALALFTSALYAFRALALRDVGQWTGFLATSLWAVLWLKSTRGAHPVPIHLHALGLSAPLFLLALLTAGLERRFGAAFTGLPGGLAQQLPRFSAVLVGVILAVVATPLFPAFSTMLTVIVNTVPAMPLAALVLLGIWLLWTWCGARLLQGLVVGPASEDPAQAGVQDLSLGATWLYTACLLALLAGGLYLMTGLT